MPHRIPTPADSLEDIIRTACLLEATAPKVGNVHPGARFEDLSYEDFVLSADAIAPQLASTSSIGVGTAILQSVQATQQAVSTNTNLGIILLIAPMADVAKVHALAMGISDALSRLDDDDTTQIYNAIRCANPGGLGQVDDQDVAQAPSIPILEAMQLSAERDLIARQYTNNFEQVLHFGIKTFLDWINKTDDCLTAIVGLQLSLMSSFPDSLIARKLGDELAKESANRAERILQAGWPDASNSITLLHELDNWLRADAHRRNPGTTADLIAAILFAVMRDKHWRPPTQITY